MPIPVKTSIKALGIANTAFSFIVPLAITFTTYFTVETAPKVGARLIGVVLAAITAFAWSRSIKKRIVMRQAQGFAPQPYKVLFANSLMPVVTIVGVTALLKVVEGSIAELFNVMCVISASEIAALGMKTWQTHFEIKQVKQIAAPQPPNTI